MKNKLSINQVAFGSLKRRGRQYRSIIIGAGLAIFFVSSLFLFAQSVYETQVQSHITRMGRQDAILYDMEQYTPEMLIESGVITEVGSLYVLGMTEETDNAVGYYDEAGLAMAIPSLIEGRLPERAGEIAVELSFLQKLRLEAGIGEQIEVALKVPTGVSPNFLPEPAAKRYTIVGILRPRATVIQDYNSFDRPYGTYPSAIVSGAELIEPGGRALEHRLVRLAPGVNEEKFGAFVNRETNHPSYEYTAFTFLRYGLYNMYFMLSYGIMLGLVLVLAACMGIVNAFSANLSDRRNQIGMMRAVGATSRQIRRIFGREVLLLSFLIAPVSIALSYLFVWGIARIAGAFGFYTIPWFLPITLAVSLGSVALAAWIPLFGASRTSPMQMIREGSLLRAKRRVKLRPRPEYSAPSLIASRHLKLYRTRQIGTAIMVALSMLIISISAPEMIRVIDYQADYAYEIKIGYKSFANYALAETEVSLSNRILDADVMEIRSLPLVSEVATGFEAYVVLLLDDVTPYGYAVLSNTWGDEDMERQIAAYQNFAEQLNLSGKALPMTILVVEEKFITALTPYLTDGKIDMSAINAGRELVLAAPQSYYFGDVYDSEGNLQGGWGDEELTEYYAHENVRAYTKDMLSVGDPLNIVRVSSPATNLMTLPNGWEDYQNSTRREEAASSIGAVVGTDAYRALSPFYWDGYSALLTTHAGFAALGLESFGYEMAAVMLDGDPDEETYAYLTETLEAIAMRGQSLYLYNWYKSVRESQNQRTMMRVSMLALLTLLLSMCVSLVNHAITNRLRSDKRSIGTLRAVGAPLSDIVRSYQLQALAMVGWGIVAGIGISVAFYLWVDLQNSWWTWSSLPFGGIAVIQAIFLLLAAIFCGTNLTVRIREITRDSIVENIREL